MARSSACATRDSISERSSSSESIAAGLDGEVVVELRQALLLDLLHLHGERGVLARELLGGVVVREGELDGALLARGRSRELLLEAGDQPAGAELHDLPAALAAIEGRCHPSTRRSP